MIPNVSSFSDLVDKKLVATLRDGRKLVGYLRSYDQYANLVFQDTVEKIYSGKVFADIPRGVLLIRGENLVYLGELDENFEANQEKFGIRKVLIDELMQNHQEESESKTRLNKLRQKVLNERGYGLEMESEAY